jgi:hypothetical protein
VQWVREEECRVSQGDTTGRLGKREYVGRGKERIEKGVWKMRDWKQDEILGARREQDGSMHACSPLLKLSLYHLCCISCAIC